MDEKSESKIAVRGRSEYKFMVNIIMKSQHRTMFVKALKPVTIDAQVSFHRLLIALALGMALILSVAYIIKNSSDKLLYVGPPVIIGGGCLAVLLVLYVISSRNKSMLSSVADMALFQVKERTRRTTTLHNEIRSVGIKTVDDDGLIHFSNGDVGYLYDVVGQISFSVLPAVAEATAAVFSQYYVARAASTQEMLLTSIQRADVRSNLDDLKKAYSKSINSQEPYMEWVGHMSSIIYDYIEENAGAEDTQVVQSLILRDTTLSNLHKSRQIFEDHAMRGMYAKASRVSGRVNIARRLRSLTMLSDNGLQKSTTRTMERGISDE